MRKLSPTATLLKSSRLFSLPPPLSRQVSELGAAPNSTSDTATLPYPIHAAIATSESGLARGDWGLKRPLPLKSTTKSSTPCVYIENIDSIDHITDFGSAAPYSRTLEKWQETDLSLSIHGQSKKERLSSAFDSKVDSTDTHLPETPRWKFDGPWLGSQTDGDFSDYLEQQVKHRRHEFRTFLRAGLSNERATLRKQQLREGGEGEEDAMATDEGSKPLSDDELDLAIRLLRNNPPGRDQKRSLDEWIEIFLDLPRGAKYQALNGFQDVSASGPPSTHPSAGLSYQRSHSHTFNHPLYGPQENKPPVEARVLLPQSDASGRTRTYAVLGIGGVATSDSKATFADKSSSSAEPAIAGFNPDLEGGAKVWRQLRRATVTSRGRIELGTQPAVPNALEAVGVTGPLNGPDASEIAKQTQNSSDMEQLVGDRLSSSRKTQGLYGLAGGIPQRSKVEPFDKEESIVNIVAESLKRPQRRL